MYKGIFHKHKQLIPLIVLTFFCIKILVACIKGTVELAGGIYEFELTPHHYGAFIAVILNILIYFLARFIYKYSLILTVVLGLFSIINFSEFVTSTTYSINSFGIKVEPSCFFVLIVMVAVNLGGIARKFSGPEKATAERNTTLLQNIRNEELEKFKELYNEKSSEDLSEIISDNRFTPAAIEAAKQIIDERSRQGN